MKALYETMERDQTWQVADLKKLVDASPMNQLYEERDGEPVPFGDCSYVDLTQEPHFFAIPPATY